MLNSKICGIIANYLFVYLFIALYINKRYDVLGTKSTYVTNEMETKQSIETGT